MRLSKYKKIILHCGFYKTGTSYLQSILNEKRDVLQEQGLEYPLTKRGPAGNHSTVAINFKEGMDVNELFERFLDFGSGCPTLLLSGETFFSHLPLNKFLEKFMQAVSNAEVQFVFYLRRPDHLLESFYAQRVKRNYHGDISGLSFRSNLFKNLLLLAEAVGKENVIIRPYNRKLWSNGQLGADFCAAIGEPDLWGSIAPVSEVLTNASFARNETFLLSRLKTEAAKRRLLAYLIANPIPPESNTKFFMSPQEHRQFRLQHAVQYQRIAETFQLGDVGEFLGISEGYEDPEWQPYIPDWEQLLYYMAKFTDNNFKV